jgi:hypothetical protein
MVHHIRQIQRALLRKGGALAEENLRSRNREGKGKKVIMRETLHQDDAVYIYSISPSIKGASPTDNKLISFLCQSLSSPRSSVS